MHRFYWLVPDALAGCSRPGSSDDSTHSSVAETLDRDLQWLRSQGIGALLSLTETALEATSVQRHGLDVLHLPVPDLTAPSPEQLSCALGWVDLQRSLGRSAAVHCLMGQGRTGTVLAAYLIRSGHSSQAAIARLREVCPGALSVQEQEWALHAFARRRDRIL